MKKILTILLSLCSITAMAQYHIRVECFGNQKIEAYYIRFTNDNWKTIYPIKDAFDNSVEGVCLPTNEDVHFQEYLFLIDNPKEQAIAFAKKFKSYYQCLKWNEDQRDKYLKLYAYRSKHPMRKNIEIPIKKHCCTITQVY